VPESTGDGFTYVIVHHITANDLIGLDIHLALDHVNYAYAIITWWNWELVPSLPGLALALLPPGTSVPGFLMPCLRHFGDAGDGVCFVADRVEFFQRRWTCLLQCSSAEGTEWESPAW